MLRLRLAHNIIKSLMRLGDTSECVCVCVSHKTVFKIEINSATNFTKISAKQHKHANALARQDGPNFQVVGRALSHRPPDFPSAYKPEREEANLHLPRRHQAIIGVEHRGDDAGVGGVNARRLHEAHPLSDDGVHNDVKNGGREGGALGGPCLSLKGLP